MSFWLKNCHRFHILTPFDLDILALPASETSIEVMFSHCGDRDLTKERKGRVFI